MDWTKDVTVCKGNAFFFVNLPKACKDIQNVGIRENEVWLSLEISWFEKKEEEVEKSGVSAIFNSSVFFVCKDTNVKVQRFLNKKLIYVNHALCCCKTIFSRRNKKIVFDILIE